MAELITPDCSVISRKALMLNAEVGSVPWDQRKVNLRNSERGRAARDGRAAPSPHGLEQ